MEGANKRTRDDDESKERKQLIEFVHSYIKKHDANTRWTLYFSEGEFSFINSAKFLWSAEPIDGELVSYVFTEMNHKGFYCVKMKLTQDTNPTGYLVFEPLVCDIFKSEAHLVFQSKLLAWVEKRVDEASEKVAIKYDADARGFLANDKAAFRCGLITDKCVDHHIQAIDQWARSVGHATMHPGMAWVVITKEMGVIETFRTNVLEMVRLAFQGSDGINKFTFEQTESGFRISNDYPMKKEAILDNGIIYVMERAELLKSVQESVFQFCTDNGHTFARLEPAKSYLFRYGARELEESKAKLLDKCQRSIEPNVPEALKVHIDNNKVDIYFGANMTGTCDIPLSARFNADALLQHVYMWGASMRYRCSINFSCVIVDLNVKMFYVNVLLKRLEAELKTTKDITLISDKGFFSVEVDGRRSGIIGCQFFDAEVILRSVKKRLSVSSVIAKDKLTIIDPCGQVLSEVIKALTSEGSVAIFCMANRTEFQISRAREDIYVPAGNASDAFVVIERWVMKNAYETAHFFQGMKICAKPALFAQQKELLRRVNAIVDRKKFHVTVMLGDPHICIKVDGKEEDMMVFKPVANVPNGNLLMLSFLKDAIPNCELANVSLKILK